MPRPRKAPYVTLKKYKDGRAPTWIIRDGQLSRGKGCHENDRSGAEKALARYITKKHDPKKALNAEDVNSIKITDNSEGKVTRSNRVGGTSLIHQAGQVSLGKHRVSMLHSLTCGAVRGPPGTGGLPTDACRMQIH